MSILPFTACCIYTIKDGKELARHFESGDQCSFEENKRWVTGNRIWQESIKDQEAVPVLLGDAADCSKLGFWGLLKHVDVDVNERKTRYLVDRIRRFKKSHSPQELVLCSTRKNIAFNFIRPYAICVTPRFINPQA